MKPVYGAVVVQTPPTADVSHVVINQQVPVVTNTVVLDSSIFKPWPIEVQCPFCHYMVNTKVEGKFNIGACCFCLCFFLIYVIFQCFRRKSLLCKDAIHFCPNCKAEIGKYEAC